MAETVSIFNFSGIYDEESFYRNDKGSSFCAAVKELNLKEVPGTNCMCDDVAKDKIRKLILEENIKGSRIRFIDNGNYHYMSAILAETVKESFSLVVFDHHPDMQPPMFGDILSCGGWVLKVIEENEYVRDVHIIDADEGLIGQLDESIRDRAYFYHLGKEASVKELADKIKPEFPVYLSIDKDVLSKGEAITNWDQGNMSFDTLFYLVKEISKKRELLYMDFCGECAKDQEGIDLSKAVASNDEINSRLLNMGLELFQ